MRVAVFFLCGAAIALLLASYVFGGFGWLLGEPSERTIALLVVLLGGAAGGVVEAETM